MNIAHVQLEETVPYQNFALLSPFCESFSKPSFKGVQAHLPLYNALIANS